MSCDTYTGYTINIYLPVPFTQTSNWHSMVPTRSKSLMDVKVLRMQLGLT